MALTENRSSWTTCLKGPTFPSSSVVEQLTVNQLAVGSNPALGAKI
tara:strand:- start:2741 stop:2878 length:138 start_codon:yes stop_codon:yes gene_type:complete